MCGEFSENLTLLLLRHAEMVKRSRQLGCDFVEDVGRDLERPKRFLQAEVGLSGFRSRVGLEEAACRDQLASVTARGN